MSNSESYWDNRFKSGEWKASKGSEQTIFHYKTLLEYMPDWLKKEISNNKMSVCDLGCGMGEGVNLLKGNFFNSEVTGVDFSQLAIKKAKEKYSNVSFVRSDINDFEKHYDVIISSHTLEHFENPFELFSKMIRLADKYFVLIIPFQEKELWKEHCYSFDYNFFPISIPEYKLVHYKEIDKLFYKEGDYWAKEQILVVYANIKNIDISKFSLEELNNTYFHELKELKSQKQELENQKQSYENELYDLKNRLEYYQKNVECQQRKIIKYRELIQETERYAEYYQKNAICLQEKQHKYVSRIKALENRSRYTKNQLKNIANTKPYRMAYALRRFSHEFLNGNINDKKNFIKWIYCKLTKKEGGLEYKYNPLMRLIK